MTPFERGGSVHEARSSHSTVEAPVYRIDLIFATQPCELRQVKYLSNLVEQDHRFIKRRVKPGLGFFSVETAWNTLQGYEVMNMVRKGQMRGVEKGDSMGQIAFIARLFGVAA